MAKERRFRIIISILLGITILWVAVLSGLYYFTTDAETVRRTNERFGIYVCGEPVMFKNAADVLGDGTVIYNKSVNRLILNNATIRCESPAIYSEIDLTVELVGENKIICTGQDTAVAIYASDTMLRKDLSICGDGALTIELGDGAAANAYGIVADDVWIESDVSVTLADAKESATGMECNDLNLIGRSSVSVNVGSAGEAIGIFSHGDISVSENGAITVTSNDSGIQCTGNVIADENASIHVTSEGSGAQIVCFGVFADYGAAVQAEVEAIGGMRKETAN